MFVKGLAVVLIAYCATSEANHLKSGLTAKWSNTCEDGYIDLPIAGSQAKEQGWKEVDHDLREDYRLLVQENVGLLYSNGDDDIQGIRFYIPCDELVSSDYGIDYDTFDGLQMINITEDFCYYYSTAFFLPADNSEGFEVWIHDRKGYYQIPNKVETISTETPFRKKNCIPGIGDLWYHLARDDDLCIILNPWSIITVNGTLAGLGFQIFGNTNFFGLNENPSPIAATYAMETSSCVIPIIKKFGFSTTHVWIVDHPADIVCKNDDGTC